MIPFKQGIMNISISICLCFFYLCVNCSSVSSEWNAMDVDFIQKLNERINLLEQRFTREQPHLLNVMDDSLSNQNNKRVTKRWIRDMENRIETLEDTILQKNCDKRIRSLEGVVQELSKQVKQQAIYNGRIEKLEAVVSDQEKTISNLREEKMQIKKTAPVIQDLLVPTEDENIKNGNTKEDSHNQSGITQRIRTPAASSDLEEIISGNKRLLTHTTPQPVTTPTIIAFYAYMNTDTPSITIQHPLVFDVIKFNNGNGYHSTTGVFIAPETGVYVFTWIIRETNGCHHSTQLMANNAEIGIIHVNAGSGGDMAGTGTVVMHVNAGDDVYVRTHEHFNNCVVVSNGAGRSSFAGWKLS